MSAGIDRLGRQHIKAAFCRNFKFFCFEYQIRAKRIVNDVHYHLKLRKSGKLDRFFIYLRKHAGRSCIDDDLCVGVECGRILIGYRKVQAFLLHPGNPDIREFSRNMIDLSCT